MPSPKGPLPQDAVTRIYDRNAPLYDLVEAPMEWLAFGRRRPMLLSGLRGRVLEVGVGTGKNFAHYPRGDLELTAVDVSARMLRGAEKRARRLGLSVDLHQADATDLPWDEGTFDAVVTSFVFCSVADAEAGMREALRVLRPGGELRMLEHQRPDARPLARAFDVLDPLTVRLSGAHVNRTTQATAERVAPGRVRARRLDRLGIVRLITVRAGNTVRRPERRDDVPQVTPRAST